MTARPRRYVFGPVPSRRLGRSLGVDLVGFKTCSYDCIYCQLGRTTFKTLERKEYVPVADVLSELREALSVGTPPDFVTLSGSGEPTLHCRLGELIGAIKSLTTVPLAVLTNGSLLSDPEVRSGLAMADVVIPSLDAGDDRLFRHVNRPHPDLSFSRIIEGLCSLRGDFKKQIWLEVFLLGGVTDTQANVKEIARMAREARPDRIQLNTVERPPAEGFAQPVPKDTLERLSDLFEPRAELVTASRVSTHRESGNTAPEDILGLLSRRPCTEKDVAEGLGIHVATAVKHLEVLAASGMVEVVYRDDRRFYVIAGPWGGPTASSR